MVEFIKEYAIVLSLLLVEKKTGEIDGKLKWTQIASSKNSAKHLKQCNSENENDKMISLYSLYAKELPYAEAPEKGVYHFAI